MTSLEMEAFLAIYRYRKISAAAESLFISQSSLSTRLQTLEKELNCFLFERGKGVRRLQPTEAGTEFYELARSYVELMQKMHSLGSRGSVQLRISTMNSVGTYLLTPVYHRFMKEHPEIRLIIREDDTDDVRRTARMDNTDMAFTSASMESDSISSVLVMEEPMVLVCSADSHYPDRVRAKDLEIRNEIFISWINGYNQWHRATFGEGIPRITLEVVEQLHFFVREPESWAVVPISVTEGLLADPKVRLVDTDFAIPKRRLFCSFRSEERSLESIRAFLDCMRREMSQPRYAGIVELQPF